MRCPADSDGAPVGMQLASRRGATLRLRTVGFDHRRTEGTYACFNLLHEPVIWGLRHAVTRSAFGNGAGTAAHGGTPARPAGRALPAGAGRSNPNVPRSFGVLTMSTQTGRPRIAVVGGGRIGSTHARNLVELGADVTVVEPDPARAAALSAALGCRVVPDAAGLPDADGAVVCTPTDTHATVVAGLLPLGIPVLLEKPCTAQPEASARLGALAEEAGVPLRIGFQRRFSPEYAVLRREYRAQPDQFGFAVFTSLDGAPPPQGYQVAGGSLAFDLQIHDIDLVLWLFGSEVVEVSASQSDASGAADLLVTTLTLASGTVCSVVSKRASPGGCQAYAELIGSRTLLDTRPLTAPGPHPDFRSRFAAAYRAEMAAFLAFVEGGPDELPHWRDAVAAETVCARIDEALSPAGAHAGASVG